VCSARCSVVDTGTAAWLEGYQFWGTPPAAILQTQTSKVSNVTKWENAETCLNKPNLS
jgi:hypothetical protein